jgi:hypothetical protein
VFGEAAAGRPDARTAEVLRALHRAKGTIAALDATTRSPSLETLGWELRSLRDWLSKTSPIVEETARRLASSERSSCPARSSTTSSAAMTAPSGSFVRLCMP